MVLFNFISWFLSFVIQDAAAPSQNQYGLSIFPNIAMTQTIKGLAHSNFNLEGGATFKSISTSHNGYSVAGGLIALVLDVIFWALLGTYLDQVVPSEFGVAKPWNFCCQFKKIKK